MDIIQQLEINKAIDERIKVVVPELLRRNTFTKPKLTDNPTDALQVVNRRYVNLNGSSANRPKGSIMGQSYFDTSANKPIWWNGTGWVDSQGTYV